MGILLDWKNESRGHDKRPNANTNPTTRAAIVTDPARPLDPAAGGTGEKTVARRCKLPFYARDFSGRMRDRSRTSPLESSDAIAVSRHGTVPGGPGHLARFSRALAGAPGRID